MDLGFAAGDDDEEWSENRPPATPAFPTDVMPDLIPDLVTAENQVPALDPVPAVDPVPAEDRPDSPEIITFTSRLAGIPEEQPDDDDVMSSPVIAAVSSPSSSSNPDLEAEPNFCAEPLITSPEVPAMASFITATPGVLPLAQAQVLYSSEDKDDEPPQEDERERVIGPPPPSALARRGPPANPIHENEWTRYFIIKSNTHKNLVLSIENNVWATQMHNEKRFNEAYDQSPYVVLLFSVNQSGRFQGYARMLGHVGKCTKPDVFNGFGRLFEVKWLKLHDLDFQELQTSSYDNPWNEGKNIRISRDGQEVPHDMGAAICRMIDQQVYDLDPEDYGDDIEEPFEFAPKVPITECITDLGPRGRFQQAKTIQTSVWHPPTQSTPSQEPRWQNQPRTLPYPGTHPIPQFLLQQQMQQQQRPAAMHPYQQQQLQQQQLQHQQLQQQQLQQQLQQQQLQQRHQHHQHHQHHQQQQQAPPPQPIYHHQPAEGEPPLPPMYHHQPAAGEPPLPMYHQEPPMYHQPHQHERRSPKPAHYTPPPRRPPMLYPPERPPAVSSAPRDPHRARNPFSPPHGYEEPAHYYREGERIAQKRHDDGSPRRGGYERTSGTPRARNGMDGVPVDMSRMSYAEYRKWHEREQRQHEPDSESDSSVDERRKKKAKKKDKKGKKHRSKSHRHRSDRKRKRSRSRSRNRYRLSFNRH